MTDATPVAPAAAVTPAADPAVTPPAVTPAADPAATAPVDSLLPADDAVAAAADPAAPAADPAAPAAPVDPNSGKAWLLAEGVLGSGEKPEWLKSDKYKTAEEQAKAYVGLEKRLGAFVGAPKDGKYEFVAPKGYEGVTVDMEHPLMKEFTTWAKEAQLSQKGYNEMLGMLTMYEAAQVPNMAIIKQQVGENADARIGAVAAWGKANLGAEGYATLRAATSGPNAADVFKVLESVIGKTKQVVLPKPGDDIPGASAGGRAAIVQAQSQKGPDGKRLMETSPLHRAAVEKMWNEYFAAGGT